MLQFLNLLNCLFLSREKYSRFHFIPIFSALNTHSLPKEPIKENIWCILISIILSKEFYIRLNLIWIFNTIPQVKPNLSLIYRCNMISWINRIDKNQTNANEHLVKWKRKVLDIKSGTCMCSPENYLIQGKYWKNLL